MGSQDTNQPSVFVCLPHSALALTWEPSSSVPVAEPWEEGLVTERAGIGQGRELHIWDGDTNAISKVLGTQSRFQLHQKLMPSGTGMLVASMSLVLVACPGNTELSGVISSKGVPVVQAVQQCWGSSPCHKSGDKQQG